MGITLDIADRQGQPAEDIVWHVDPFKPEPGYAARIASVLGLTGPGTVGAVPAGGAPDRTGRGALVGDKVLAVNETTGELYYFDRTRRMAPPGRSRTPRPSGCPSDPTQDFGWTADLEPSTAGLTVFRGTEVTARAEHVINGSWLGPGYRETAVLFPRYAHPTDPSRQGGVRIYAPTTWRS